jgi:hypothetical protein
MKSHLTRNRPHSRGWAYFAFFVYLTCPPSAERNCGPQGREEEERKKERKKRKEKFDNELGEVKQFVACWNYQYHA